MTRRKVSFLQGTVAAPYKLPAEDHRLNHAGLWVPSSVANAGLRVRSGLLPGPGNPGRVTVVAGGVNINPFQAVIQGTLSATQGVYEVVADALEFRAITAASSTEFRRGYVIARVYDQLNAGTGTVKDDWDIEVLYGPNAATAGAATLPPLPANTLVLREFAVSNTGVITLAGSPPPWTVARGGIPPVADDDPSSGAYDGQYRDHPTWGLQRWSATRGRWEKWGGPPVLIASDPDVGGGANFSGGTLESKTLAVPAHSGGTLHVQFTGSWYAASAQAVTGRLTYGAAAGLGSPEVQGSAMRSPNNGVANTPVAFVCDGYIATDGSASTLRLVTTAEVVTNTFIAEGAFRVWLD